MAFEILDEGAFISVRLFGVLTSKDFEAGATRLERIERESSTPKNRVTDLTGIERIDLGFQEVFELAERRTRRPMGGRVKSAVIARSPLHFGFARMFQMLNNNPEIEIRIVDSMEAALDWFSNKN
jgi:hypothetical protein